MSYYILCTHSYQLSASHALTAMLSQLCTHSYTLTAISIQSSTDHTATRTNSQQLVQSILPNYETSDTPPPDPPLQRRRARKSTCADPIYFLVYWIYADPIYFFSILDVVKHLHSKGRKYSTGTGTGTSTGTSTD